MADVTVGAKLQLDGGEAQKTMKEFKQEIKLANQELLNTRERFGETAKETLDAAKKVAILKDNIKDANETVNLFDPGNKFKVIGNSVNALVGGFTALTGAMGLLGIESKEVQAQILRVQSALALTQGLSAITDSAKDFRRLAAVISSSVVGAFNALRAAIGATGIGALIIGIGALVAGIYRLTRATNDEVVAAKAQEEITRKQYDASQKLVQGFDLQERRLRALGKTELEITNARAEATKQLLNDARAQLKSLELIAQATDKTFNKQQENVKKSGFRGAGGAALFNILFGVSKKEVAEAHSNVNNIKSQIEELDVVILELDKKKKDIIAGQKIKTTREKDEKPVERLKRDSLATDPAVQLEIEKNNLILELHKGFNQELINQDSLRTAYEKANAAVRAYEAEQEALAKIEAAKSVGNALDALSNLIGQQTAAGKTLGIAQATINMWIGVSEVLRNKTVLPEPFGTINKIASITAVVATGLNAIRNIVKVKVPGAGGSSGVQPVSANAPIQPGLSVTSTRLNAAQINQIGNAAAVRAYVVESDITGKQQRMRRLHTAARI